MRPNSVTLAMDSTLIESQRNKHLASKLPIKRKTPDQNYEHESNTDPIGAGAPPFKFHRIWTEPDEIRFLQGLLDCSLQNLAFPRDLGIFYARFSDTMSQPYTRSQLSEKLRRLRKKFRVISTRLSKGMDRSQLSLHDRALYHLSERLWHPEFAATSPFSGARNVGLNHSNHFVGGDDDGNLKNSNLVGIEVNFVATLPPVSTGFVQENDCNLELDSQSNENEDDTGGRAGLGDSGNDGSVDDEVKLSEVNVELEGEEDEEDEAFVAGEEEAMQDVDNEIGKVAAKVVVNVYDECLKEMKRLISGGSGEREDSESFHARWQQQRVAELDVLGSRLRLVLQHSVGKKLTKHD